MNIRISKYLSSAGICSRRDAEKLIVEKKIKINNQICVHPSYKVNDLDIIKVNNKIVTKINKVEVWKLFKPIKYICCLLYTSPSPRDRQKSRMPSSA